MTSDDQQPEAGGEKDTAAGSRSDAPASAGQEAAATRLWPWLVGLTVPLYIFDQVTKFWVIRTFPTPWSEAPLEERMIEVVPGFLNWVRVHNQGVAFGMGNGTEWAPLVFPFVSLIAFVLITIGLKTRFFVGKLGMLAVSLLITGICGNLTDRLIQGSLLEELEGAPLWERLKAGYVVDFVDVIVPFTGGWHWPSFNVADSCICIAAVLLFIVGWKEESSKR